MSLFSDSSIAIWPLIPSRSDTLAANATPPVGTTVDTAFSDRHPDRQVPTFRSIVATLDSVDAGDGEPCVVKYSDSATLPRYELDLIVLPLGHEWAGATEFRFAVGIRSRSSESVETGETAIADATATATASGITKQALSKTAMALYKVMTNRYMDHLVQQGLGSSFNGDLVYTPEYRRMSVEERLQLFEAACLQDDNMADICTRYGAEAVQSRARGDSAGPIPVGRILCLPPVHMDQA
jgi:hypothetical protein